MWFDFGFDTSHDMEFGKMSKAAHSTLQSSLSKLLKHIIYSWVSNISVGHNNCVGRKNSWNEIKV